MAGKCEICGKILGFGNNVSHSHLKTRRVFKPNIQKVKIEINGTIKKTAVCTKCLKANKAKKTV